MLRMMLLHIVQDFAYFLESELDADSIRLTVTRCKLQEVALILVGLVGIDDVITFGIAHTVTAYDIALKDNTHEFCQCASKKQRRGEHYYHSDSNYCENNNYYNGFIICFHVAAIFDDSIEYTESAKGTSSGGNCSDEKKDSVVESEFRVFHVCSSLNMGAGFGKLHKTIKLLTTLPL